MGQERALPKKSEYRLFLEIRVFEQLRALKAAERNRLLEAMEQILQRPEHCSDYTETDSEGRTVAIHIAGRFAVKSWEDAADRHIKVLDLHLADRAKEDEDPR